MFAWIAVGSFLLIEASVTTTLLIYLVSHCYQCRSDVNFHFHFLHREKRATAAKQQTTFSKE